MDELHEDWFAKGEGLADSEEPIEEAPRPNLLARFGLALAASALLVAALVGVASALA